MLLSIINSLINLDRKQFVKEFLKELEEAIEEEDIKKLIELYETEEDYSINWFDINYELKEKYKRLVKKANEILL